MSKFPRFFYGTAWKEDQTADLTLVALQAGFTAIDTANQRKHYFEEAVGQGIKKFLEISGKTRNDLFLQTKFTYARGQDHRKPYNDQDPFTRQVEDSFKSSLQHLQTDFIDSYVLHGPYGSGEPGAEDLETWAAMEKLVASQKVKFLGVSNVSAQQLQSLCRQVKIKPTFVQNRCYARMGWDKEVREICQREGLHYQGFSLLTANRTELGSLAMSSIMNHHKKSIPQIVFRFSQQIGMICLTGTSSLQHMKQDLEIEDFELSPQEIKQIENIAF